MKTKMKVKISPVAQKREVIIVGDVEMGGGTITDDFIADARFSTLILGFATQNIPVDLILNGDTFDFLKCPYVVNGIRTYPRHITAQISLSKLEQMYLSHTRVFEALSVFVKKKENRLYFIIGNHDPDLVFSQVQRKIRNLLKNKDKTRDSIHFTFRYDQFGVYVEHGHQHDFLNKVNKKKLFLDFKGERILNIPWVSFSLISNFMTMKEEHPFSERIKPWPLMFSHHRVVVHKLNKRSFEYLFKCFLYYPLRYFRDPTYWVPTELFREIYRRFKDTHWDVDEVMAVFQRKQRWKRIETHQIHVLGHIHRWYVEEHAGRVFIHPDTWRDEYIFEEETRLLKPKDKRYVKVSLENGRISDWQMVEVPNIRKNLHFDEVIKDEKGWLRKAAHDEGYELKL